MKKKLGALFLALASVAISAACASSGTSYKPTSKPESFDGWAKKGNVQSPAVESPAVRSRIRGV